MELTHCVAWHSSIDQFQDVVVEHLKMSTPQITDPNIKVTHRYSTDKTWYFDFFTGHSFFSVANVKAGAPGPQQQAQFLMQ